MFRILFFTAIVFSLLADSVSAKTPSHELFRRAGALRLEKRPLEAWKVLSEIEPAPRANRPDDLLERPYPGNTSYEDYFEELHLDEYYLKDREIALLVEFLLRDRQTDAAVPIAASAHNKPLRAQLLTKVFEKQSRILFSLRDACEKAMWEPPDGKETPKARDIKAEWEDMLAKAARTVELLDEKDRATPIRTLGFQCVLMGKDDSAAEFLSRIEGGTTRDAQVLNWVRRLVSDAGSWRKQETTLAETERRFAYWMDKIHSPRFKAWACLERFTLLQEGTFYPSPRGVPERPDWQAALRGALKYVDADPAVDRDKIKLLDKMLRDCYLASMAEESNDVASQLERDAGLLQDPDDRFYAILSLLHNAANSPECFRRVDIPRLGDEAFELVRQAKGFRTRLRMLLGPNDFVHWPGLLDIPFRPEFQRTLFETAREELRSAGKFPDENPDDVRSENRRYQIDNQARLLTRLSLDETQRRRVLDELVPCVLRLYDEADNANYREHLMGSVLRHAFDFLAANGMIDDVFRWLDSGNIPEKYLGELYASLARNMLYGRRAQVFDLELFDRLLEKAEPPQEVAKLRRARAQSQRDATLRNRDWWERRIRDLSDENVPDRYRRILSLLEHVPPCGFRDGPDFAPLGAALLRLRDEMEEPEKRFRFDRELLELSRIYRLFSSDVEEEIRDDMRKIPARQ